KMRDTIRYLLASCVTVLLTTQHLKEADQLSDRIAVIDRGRIVDQGTPTQLKDSIGGSSLQVTLADQTAEGAARQIISHNFGPEAIHTSCQGQLTVAMQQANDAATVLLA